MKKICSFIIMSLMTISTVMAQGMTKNLPEGTKVSGTALYLSLIHI